MPPTTHSTPSRHTAQESEARCESFQKAIQSLQYAFVTSLGIVPILQGVIVLCAGLPARPHREHLTELLSCWVGFTATIWILLLLGTLSAYKVGSYVSTYHAILVVFIVAAEPSIAYCIWGDQYCMLNNFISYSYILILLSSNSH
ncbi:hypothetical protein EV363DRAFT_1175095 [Boletus edulis]|nr:hypothetical protein EV363DRAFT_1175095 [Boletus edulis]